MRDQDYERLAEEHWTNGYNQAKKEIEEKVKKLKEEIDEYRVCFCQRKDFEKLCRECNIRKDMIMQTIESKKGIGKRTQEKCAEIILDFLESYIKEEKICINEEIVEKIFAKQGLGEKNER